MSSLFACIPLMFMCRNVVEAIVKTSSWADRCIASDGNVASLVEFYVSPDAVF